MTVSTIAIWLLLSMGVNGQVHLRGQFWSEQACKAEWATYQPDAQSRMRCFQLTTPK
jgi:hypothetical protein